MYKKILCWILLICWAALIFSFSAQAADESQEISMSLSEKIADIILLISKFDFPVFNNIDYASAQIIGEAIHNTIRKIAHFSLYFILAVFAMLVVCEYNIKKKKGILICLLFCFLYAVSDEIHQLFVPGRGCQAIDVLIDFLGSLFGVCIFLFISKIINTIKTKKAYN